MPKGITYYTDGIRSGWDQESQSGDCFVFPLFTENVPRNLLTYTMENSAEHILHTWYTPRKQKVKSAYVCIHIRTYRVQSLDMRTYNRGAGKPAHADKKIVYQVRIHGLSGWLQIRKKQLKAAAVDKVDKVQQ